MSRLVKRPRLSDDYEELIEHADSKSWIIATKINHNLDGAEPELQPNGFAADVINGRNIISALRSRRGLSNAFKSKLLAVEDVNVQITFAINGDNKNFGQNFPNGIDTINNELANYIGKIEFLSMATKHIPDHVKDMGPMLKCDNDFSGNSEPTIKIT